MRPLTDLSQHSSSQQIDILSITIDEYIDLTASSPAAEAPGARDSSTLQIALAQPVFPALAAPLPPLSAPLDLRWKDEAGVGKRTYAAKHIDPKHAIGSARITSFFGGSGSGDSGGKATLPLASGSGSRLPSGSQRKLASVALPPAAAALQHRPLAPLRSSWNAAAENARRQPKELKGPKNPKQALSLESSSSNRSLEHFFGQPASRPRSAWTSGSASGLALLAALYATAWTDERRTLE